MLHIFGSNSADKPHAMNGSKLLGSIAYAAPGQRFAPESLVGAYGLSGMLVKDVVAIASTEHTHVAPFWFGNYMCTAQKPCVGNRCENVCLAVHAGTPVYNQAGLGMDAARTQARPRPPGGDRRREPLYPAAWDL